MKYIVSIISFIVIFGLYTFLDNLGYQNYTMLEAAYGTYALVMTIMLNIIISIFSAITIQLSFDNAKANGNFEGISLSSIGNLIGVFFAGCTSCGINLLAAIGISFSLPLVTPGAIEFKLLAFLLVLAGYFYIVYRIKHPKCKVKL